MYHNSWNELFHYIVKTLHELIHRSVHELILFTQPITKIAKMNRLTVLESQNWLSTKIDVVSSLTFSVLLFRYNCGFLAVLSLVEEDKDIIITVTIRFFSLLAVTPSFLCCLQLQRKARKTMIASIRPLKIRCRFCEILMATFGRPEEVQWQYSH